VPFWKKLRSGLPCIKIIGVAITEKAERERAGWGHIPQDINSKETNMCWITKKTHQKAIAELRKEIDELALDVSGLSYSHDLTLEAYDRCTDELTQIKNELMPPPVDTSQQFDPKVTPYPEELGGMKLGFVKAKEDCYLWGADKDNVLYPYENAEWGNNTLARRIQVKATRAAVAVNREGTEYAYGTVRPFSFDGGAVAYEVCPDQEIDGKKLWTEPKLYIRLQDVEAL
jgi:hypothetical protein